MLAKMMTAAAVLAAAMQAQADERLITPTLWAHAPDMFACNLTNIDDRAHTVQVRIISDGRILLESKKLSLAPRHTTNHKVDGFKNGGPIYCEFSVEEPKTVYRGAAKVFRAPDGTDIAAIAAQ